VRLPADGLVGGRLHGVRGRFDAKRDRKKDMGETLKSNKGKTVAVIVAAGVGSRLKSKVRKPFVRLRGKPMLGWTLEAFEKAPSIGGVVVVVHRSNLQTAQRMIRSFGFRKVIRVVPGGATRVGSVACGLKAVPVQAQWVAVHDGARPLVTSELIEQTVQEARRSDAAIAAIPVIPTIKQAEGRWVKKTLDRKRLWAVQTPQVFERTLLERAHAKAGTNGASATDDATLVEALEHRVRIVMGDPRNFKVTTPADLIMAEALLDAGRDRI